MQLLNDVRSDCICNQLGNNERTLTCWYPGIERLLFVSCAVEIITSCCNQQKLQKSIDSKHLAKPHFTRHLPLDSSMSASSLPIPWPTSPTPSRRSRSAFHQHLPLLSLALVVFTGLVIMIIDLPACSAESSSSRGHVETQKADVLEARRRQTQALDTHSTARNSEQKTKSGCQTIVFFHIPKTGGESMNHLWGSHHRMFGCDRYRTIAIRTTEKSVPALPSMSILDQNRFLGTM